MAVSASGTAFALPEGSPVGSAQEADVSSELETLAASARSLIDQLGLAAPPAIPHWQEVISVALVVAAAGALSAHGRRRRSKRELKALLAEALAKRKTASSDTQKGAASPTQERPRADPVVPAARPPTAGSPVPDAPEPCTRVGPKDDSRPRAIAPAPPREDRPGAAAAASARPEARDLARGQELVDQVFRAAWEKASLAEAPSSARSREAVNRPSVRSATPLGPADPTRANAKRKLEGPVVAREERFGRADPGALDQALAAAWEQALLEPRNAKPVPPSPPAAPAAPIAPPRAEPTLPSSEKPDAGGAPEPPKDPEEPVREITGVPEQASLVGSGNPPPPSLPADPPHPVHLDARSRALPAPVEEPTSTGQGPGPGDYSRLCEALLERSRFEAAATLAREGLDVHPGEVCLLLSFSRALAGLGRADAALDAAREAHRVCRSRASLMHLIHLLTAARRFDPGDGERLRQAVARHPEEPLLLHAAGVFEALHGDPWAARGLLLEALRHEKRGEVREEISRELARLQAAGQGARAGDTAPSGAPVRETARASAADRPACS